jgi:signal transduction histidine kinase
MSLTFMAPRLLRDPRRLQAAFLVVMLLFTATLGWLAWTLVEQDRELQATRVADAREAAADLIVAALDRRLSTLVQQLDQWAVRSSAQDEPGVPSDTVVVRFDRPGVTAWPAGGLIYDPTISTAAAADREATMLIERAGVYSSQRRSTEALATYSRVEARGAALVAGMPAALAARLGRLLLYERTGNSEAIAGEARMLARDLESGRWPVSHAAFKNLADAARRHLLPAERRPARAEALTDAITWLWDEWTGERLDGRWANQSTPAGPVLLMWRDSGPALVALAGGQSFVERDVLTDVKPIAAQRHMRLSLVSPIDGGSIIEEQHETGSRSSVRLAGDTRLPWTVRVSSVAADDPAIASRRTMFLTGLGVVVAFVLTGAWFVGRAVTRELEVARLKSDFVAAVSHEFRTPLTTLVQLSELLQGGRVATEADRQAYYELLSAESHRLRRLVERLLSFGRVESGRLSYQLAPLDLGATVTACAEQFRARHDLSRHRFELHVDPDAMLDVHGDAEALSTALLNLLENAVKYSPEGGPIRVDVSGTAARVTITVRDEGIGISRAEQARIFEPFERGEAARDRQIRGTGIGLALARGIARAHGGDITVDSEPGRGSAFRVTLPRRKPDETTTP